LKGRKKVEEQAVIEKLEIRKGMRVDNYQIRDAIKDIYGMKFFEKVEAHQQGGTLLFRVTERPLISQIEILGNEEVNDDEIREQMKAKKFNILDINTLKADVNKIEKFYEDKGFYLARAKYEVKKINDRNVIVTINIKEYDNVRVKKITFLGNEALKDDELKTFMQTREDSFFSFFSNAGNFKEFNFQGDIERIKYLYKSRGYLQVNVGTPSITVTEDKKWIFITVKINEGPKFTVNNIFFGGDLLFSDGEMRQKLSLKPNETYSEESLRKDIQALTEMYQDEGYAFANVLRTLEIVPGENKVDIVFSFEKGQIAYFGKISVKGNTKTRDKVVRRELRIHEGMRYSGSLLRKSKANVVRLGFFEPGSVIFNTITPKGKDNVLDVEISIKERQTGQISIGAGYSTATKAFLQASVSQNNFRGLGQVLNFSLSLSDQQNLFNLGFTEPYYNDTLWTAGFDVFNTVNRNITSFNFERYGFDFRVGYPIYEYTRLFLTYQWERTTIDDAVIPNPTIKRDEVNGIASSLTASLIWDKRNNIFEPTDGHYVRSSVEVTGLLGDQKWLKGEVEGRLYHPIYKDLTFRSRISYSQLFETTSRPIPRTEKYSLGGARNMRGYRLEAIGPRQQLTNQATTLPEVFNLGGLSSLLATIELEYPLVKDAGLKFVTFYDAGGVPEKYFGKGSESNRLYFDYGFGFRWFSPIGVLRFEFAYPVNDIPGEDTSQQFHFDIGQLF
jgi:outer membrane protein insertion porin family